MASFFKLSGYDNDPINTALGMPHARQNVYVKYCCISDISATALSLSLVVVKSGRNRRIADFLAYRTHHGLRKLTTVGRVRISTVHCFLL
jgi:hypothetical protein